MLASDDEPSMTAADSATPAAARRAAWDVLTAYLVADPSRARLGTRKRPFPPPDLEPRDRALARDIAEGSVARIATLDAILADVARGRTPRPQGLRAALLLSAWQLFYAPDLPAHSIVHAGVALARRAAGEGGAKFANALLRKLAATRDPAAWLEASRAQGDELDWLAIWHSLPREILERWMQDFGREATFAIAEASNSRPPTSLRITAQSTPDEVAASLRAAGCEVREGLAARNLLVTRPHANLIETQAFKDGHFAIQDTTQIEVVDLVVDQARRFAERSGRGELRILDLCAAPGTKTCAIAEALPNARVFAYDSASDRLAQLLVEAGRLGLDASATGRVQRLETAAALEAAAAAEPFDLVLVDAPCSNSGVLARRPEARWRLSANTIERHAQAQVALVLEALRYVRAGSPIVFATCSIEFEENEGVARDLAATGRVRVVSSERSLPETALRDGGGVTVFERLDDPGGT